MVSYTKLTTSIASDCIYKILICYKRCMLRPTWYFLYCDSINTKPRLWLSIVISRTTVYHCFTTLSVNHSKSKLTVSIRAPTEYFCVKFISFNLYYILYIWFVKKVGIIKHIRWVTLFWLFSFFSLTHWIECYMMNCIFSQSLIPSWIICLHWRYLNFIIW